MWHLEDNDPMSCGIDCMDDDGLEDIFGDIVGAVGKIATAPINAVASVLPKPVGDVLKTAHTIGAPHLLLDPKMRSTVSKTLGLGQPATRANVSPTARAAATKIAAQTGVLRPRVFAKSTGPKIRAVSSKAENQQQLLAKLVADAVAKKVDPRLKTISAKLALAENQRLATSEHNAINNVTAFRRKVLADLMRISACLPESHPTRQKIRRVGLMSGLL